MKILSYNAGKIAQASRQKKKKKKPKTKNRSSIVINSIKSLKIVHIKKKIFKEKENE